jgi:hypothetical protein
MIKTKVESISSNAVSQELEVQGSTKVLLLELRALVTGVLNNMTLSAKGTDRELTIDERIDLFCKLMKR